MKILPRGSLSLVAAAALTLACGGTTSRASADGSGGGTSTGTAGSGNTGTGTTTTNVEPDRSCTTHQDCVVVPVSCCGSCGAPTASDSLAIRAETATAYRNAVCKGDFACPACAQMPNGMLTATCEAGVCTLQDLQATNYTSCELGSDCTLAVPGCGVAPSDGALSVALNKASLSAYAGTYCGSDETCIASCASAETGATCAPVTSDTGEALQCQAPSIL